MELSDLTLLQVNIITRHGSRCPLQPYSLTDKEKENETNFWKEQLIPMDTAKKVNELFELKGYNVAYSDYPYSRLTFKGFKQLIDVGKNMRKKYIENGFLKEPCNKKDIKIYASGYERTQRSAQGFLCGLFNITQESVKQDYYPVINTTNKAPSIFDRIIIFILATDEYLNKMREQKEFVERMNNETKEYLDIVPIIRKYINAGEKYQFIMDFDYFISHKDFNIEIPEEISIKSIF